MYVEVLQCVILGTCIIAGGGDWGGDAVGREIFVTGASDAERTGNNYYYLLIFNCVPTIIEKVRLLQGAESSLSLLAVENRA